MPPDRARLVVGIAAQLDALAGTRGRVRLPPSPLTHIRQRRARHWKARVALLQHLIALVALVAVVAFIALCYHALTIYGARQGYGTPRGGEARVAIALFLGGGLVGGVVVYVVMAGRGRGG